MTEKKPKDSGAISYYNGDTYMYGTVLPPLFVDHQRETLARSTSCIVVSHCRFKKINHAVSAAWEAIAMVYF